MLFLTFSWSFVRSNPLELLECRLENLIGIKKPTGKVKKEVP
jgi:hypothetical protein